LKEEYIMRKLCLSFLAQVIMGSTILAGSGTTVAYVTYAKIIDIEEVWRTNRVKQYSNCRDILDKKNGLTGRKTLCDDIEWKTINESIDFYRVTYDLYGKTFQMKHKSRPIGTEKRMSITVKSYGK